MAGVALPARGVGLGRASETPGKCRGTRRRGECSLAQIVMMHTVKIYSL